MSLSRQHSADLATRYIRFAAEEADGRSSLYKALACGVAGDPDVLGFLLGLPEEKQQPNLLFAAVRRLFGTPAGWPQFRWILLTNSSAVRSVMLTHATQTNEPARCAVLLPVLAQLPQPLALIEVGASAGLCLLPDLYGYRYGERLIRPKKIDRANIKPPIFSCSANEATPLPSALPQVIWRAGLDLNPLNVAEPSHATWLETLVWPEQAERLTNLRAALRIASGYKPRVVKGDLAGSGLAQLCDEAPKNATLVVFHTAVLSYLPQAERRAFTARIMSLCPYWISNEAPGVLPDITSRVGTSIKNGRFLLSVNGSPVAWTDPHGAAIEWIEDRSTPDSM